MKPLYFYENEAEQFTFYRIPKALFTDKRYAEISVESKVLYGILLDRMSLSLKNRWTDDHRRVYIIFTVEDMMEAVNCSRQKISKLLKELEMCYLIQRKRQGLGRPNLIYVMKFVEPQKQNFLKFENHTSGSSQIIPQEVPESYANNTDSSKTELSDTESHLFPSVREETRFDAKDREEYRNLVMENIGYDQLLSSDRCDADMLEEILELMVDVICSGCPTLRISGDDKPTEVVRAQFLKLEQPHIQFVLDSLAQNTSLVRNIRQYLLATLYNAPLTMNSYYRGRVNHDMAEGM